MTKEEVEKLWMDNPESMQFLKNATKFYNLMMMYRCAIREIQTKLEVLDDEFSVENNRNPISFIKTRIKKPNSIYNKLQKMGHDFTTENIQTYLNDVAGVRIVCAFIDDIYMISDLITQQDDIKVIEVKDYIKNPKPNGYRSYHMIVEIPVFFAKGKTPMRVELQIRTNGMDFWATLEHQLRYKKGIEEMPGYEEISEELLHSARAIIEADNEMQRIKEDVYKRQSLYEGIIFLSYFKEKRIKKCQRKDVEESVDKIIANRMSKAYSEWKSNQDTQSFNENIEKEYQKLLETLSPEQEKVLTKYCDEIFASGAETEEFFYRLGIKDGLRLKSTVKSVLEMMS